jgi:hypothetical protein
VTEKDAYGNQENSAGEATPSLSASVGSLGSLTDNHNGTLTATWAAPGSTVGSPAIISGTISSVAIGTSASITLTAAGVDHYLVSAPANASVGVPFNVTATAKDAGGNTVATDNSDSVTLAGYGSATVATNPVTLAAGVAVFSVTDNTAETITGITATDGNGKTGTSGSVQVNANKYVITLPGQTFVNGTGNTNPPAAQTAGTAFNLGVRVVDANTNTVTSLDEQGVTLTFSGPASSPSGAAPSYTTTVDITNGVAVISGGGSSQTNLPATLVDAQTTAILVTDGTIAGQPSSSLTVNPGATAQYAVVASTPQISGLPFNVTVTAEDAYLNPVTADSSDSVTLSAMGNAVAAANPLTLANGVAIFSVTDNTAETITIKATDGENNTGTSSSITVNADVLDHFAISTIASSQTAGTPIAGITLTAQDAENNTLTLFTNTVTYSGTAGITGTSAVFTAGVLSGVSITPTVAGSSLTFIVTATGGTAYGTTSFTVSPAIVSAANSVISASPTSVIAGGASTITVTEKDAYGNQENSSGEVTPVLSVPSSSSLGTLTDNHNGTFTATLTTSTNTANGPVAVTGTISGVAIGTSASVALTTGPATQLAFTTLPSTGTAGTAFSVRVQTQDANGNPSSPTSSTTITLSKATGGGTLSGTLTGTISTGGNNVVISTPVYSKSDTMTLTATATAGETSLAPVTSGNIVFSPGAVSPSVSTATASPVTGVTADGATASTITVTAEDANGNPISGLSATLSASPSTGVTITQPSGTTGANGQITGTVVSTVAETTTITTVIGSTTLTSTKPTVTFVPGPFSAANSTITASPGSIVGNGVNTSAITVQAEDAHGNNLTSSQGTCLLNTTAGALSAVTDNNNGTYSATLTSANAVETANITGTIGGATIGNPASVNFTAPMTLSWDSSKSNSGGTDGAGTWETGVSTATYWYSTNSSLAVVWANGDNASVGAGGTAANILLNSAVTVNNLTFNSETTGGYDVSGGAAADIMTFTGGTIEDDNTNAVTYMYKVSLAGTNGITKTGLGALALDDLVSTVAPTNLMGPLRVAAGTLETPGGSVVFTNTLEVDSGATYDIYRYNPMVDALVDGVGTPGGTIIDTAVPLAANTFTIGDNNGSGTFSGSISPVTNSTISLTKVGTGTQVFKGTSTFTGATTVSNGAVILNGTWGATPVTVISGATFGGTGTAAGNVTYQSGAIATNTIGSPLTVSGNLTLSTTAFEVFIPAASSPLGMGTNALVNYSGTLTGSPNATPTITGGSIASGDRVVIVVDKTGKHVNLAVEPIPVANAVTYSHGPGVSLMISIANLLTNATDANGDTLTLAGVGTDGYNLATTTGSTLATNSTYILYTNSTPANVNDSFQYVVSDGSGGLATNTVTIDVVAVVGQTNAPVVLTSSNATLTFFGIPGTNYDVERATNLTAPVTWVDLGTSTAPANGVFQVIDNFTDLGSNAPPQAYWQLLINP